MNQTTILKPYPRLEDVLYAFALSYTLHVKPPISIFAASGECSPSADLLNEYVRLYPRYGKELTSLAVDLAVHYGDDVAIKALQQLLDRNKLKTLVSELQEENKRLMQRESEAVMQASRDAARADKNAADYSKSRAYTETLENRYTTFQEWLRERAALEDANPAFTEVLNHLLHDLKDPIRVWM